MANTLKPQVGGLGLGAATPAQSPYFPEAKKPDPYVPSVTRARVGSVPQADQPTPTTPVRRYTPPRPIGPVHIPPGGVQAPARVRSVANVASSGISGIWDATIGNAGKVVDIANRPINAAGTAIGSRLPSGRIGSAIKTPFGGYGGTGLEGAFNKAFYLTSDVAAVNQSFQNIINPDKTAEIIYNANPGNYASLDEAKNEVRNFNAGELFGIIGENIAQVAASRTVGSIITAAITWSLRGAAAAGAIAAAPVELPALAVFAISVATFAAMNMIYGKVSEMTSAQSQDQATFAKTSPDLYTKMVSGQDQPEGIAGMYSAMSEGGIGGQMAGTFANSMISNFADGTSREPGQRSHQEVAQLRQERGSYKLAGYVTDYNADGFPTKLPLYATFGSRQEEVAALFTAGYFLTPAGTNDMGGFHPYTDSYGRRIMEVDYPTFVKWLEDTDWLANDNPGIAQRVFQLPRISDNTLALIKQGGITSDEWRAALKFWYDKGANEQQTLLLAPKP